MASHWPDGRPCWAQRACRGASQAMAAVATCLFPRLRRLCQIACSGDSSLAPVRLRRREVAGPGAQRQYVDEQVLPCTEVAPTVPGDGAYPGAWSAER